MTMPNFLILGAAKAGTTALYHYLKQHPQVGMSRTKETNFFALKDEPVDFRGPGDQEYIGRFSVTTLDGYQAQFRACAHAMAIGEASPLYLYSPKAPGCIRQFVPEAKLIAILRNPISRAYSAFLHLVRDGREPVTDFGEALRREEQRIADRWEHIWHYKRMGLYYEQLSKYFEVFDRSQIRVYLYSDFRNDPLGVLRDVFRFLGVDEGFVPDTSAQHNVATVPLDRRPPLPPDLWMELHEVFRADVLKLQDLIGRDLSRWLSTPLDRFEPLSA
jgi:Sulfotransferase family